MSELDTSWDALVHEMAVFLVDHCGFDPLWFADEPVSVRLGDIDQAVLVEPMAQWLWAEMKRHRCTTRRRFGLRRQGVRR
jgi:hypothetical protein